MAKLRPIPAWVYLVHGTFKPPSITVEEDSDKTRRFHDSDSELRKTLKGFKEVGIPVILFNPHQEGIYAETTRNFFSGAIGKDLPPEMTKHTKILSGEALDYSEVNSCDLEITNVKLLGKVTLCPIAGGPNPFPGDSPTARALVYIEKHHETNVIRELLDIKEILQS